MGFRNGAFCKIWDVAPISDTSTKARISISVKDKQTGEYKDDFGGYVMFIGTANAQKAAKLVKGARIKLGDVDVSTRYDAERKTTYTNFKVFSFEDPDAEQATPITPVTPTVNSTSGRDLPF